MGRIANAQDGPGTSAAVRPVVTAVASGKVGYTTYQIACGFDPATTRDVYALYGDSSAPLSIPAAFQVPTPFGSSVGPVNPAFYAVMPDAQYDSFLTLGMDGPALNPGALSSIGLDFDSWTETSGIESTNGAVFFMDPEHGATTEPVVVAQLTVPTGTSFRGTISAQGRSFGDGLNGGAAEDWDVVGMTFDSRARPPPPPPRPPPPPPPPRRPPPPPAAVPTPAPNTPAFGGPSPPVFYHGVECTLEGKKQGDVLCDGSIYQPHACTAREWLHNGHCIPLFCSRYFDGCNNCELNGRRMGSCTQDPCPPTHTPDSDDRFCLEYTDGRRCDDRWVCEDGLPNRYISVTVRASMGASTADNRQPYRTAVTQPPPPPPSAPGPAPAPSGGVACRAGDTGDDCQTGWCKAGVCGEQHYLPLPDHR